MKQIDEHNLDREWIRQPEAYYKAAEELAEASHGMELAKAREAVVQATVALAVRQSPEKYGIVGKPTVDAVSEAVILDPSFQKAQSDHAVARYKRDLAKAQVEALDHRRTALSNLVQLHLGSYYATPSASKDTQEVLDTVSRERARSSGVRRRQGG